MSTKDKKNYYSDFWNEVLYENSKNIEYIVNDKEVEDMDKSFVLSLLEDENYMQDYIPNESGDIVKVRFDHIGNILKKDDRDKK